MKTKGRAVIGKGILCTTESLGVIWLKDEKGKDKNFGIPEKAAGKMVRVIIEQL